MFVLWTLSSRRLVRCRGMHSCQPPSSHLDREKRNDAASVLPPPPGVRHELQIFKWMHVMQITMQVGSLGIYAGGYRVVGGRQDRPASLFRRGRGRSVAGGCLGTWARRRDAAVCACPLGPPDTGGSWAMARSRSRSRLCERLGLELETALFPHRQSLEQVREVFIHDKRRACSRKDAERVGAETLVEAEQALVAPDMRDDARDGKVGTRCVLDARAHHLVRVREGDGDELGGSRGEDVLGIGLERVCQK